MMTYNLLSYSYETKSKKMCIIMTNIMKWAVTKG